MDLPQLPENNASPSNKKRVRLSLKSSHKKQYTQHLFPEFHSSFPIIEDSPKTPNPRIILPTPKKHLHERINLRQCTEQNDESKGVERSEEYGKLQKIRSRCIDCFENFMEEKDKEIKMVKKTFIEIHFSLNESFNAIMDDVKVKHNELKQFLNAKLDQLLLIKDLQSNSLKQNLASINSAHQQTYQSNLADSEKKLHNYANILHKFYATIENVSKVNFQQKVQEVASFTKNFINQQILGVKQTKMFTKDTKESNASFSFNGCFGENQNKAGSVSICNCLSRQREILMIESQTQTSETNQINKRELAHSLCDITQKQKNLSHKINSYKELVSKNCS